MHDENGATAVEYGILLAAIAVVIVVAVSLLGSLLSEVFGNVSSAFDTTGNTPGGCKHSWVQPVNPNCEI